VRLRAVNEQPLSGLSELDRRALDPECSPGELTKEEDHRGSNVVLVNVDIGDGIEVDLQRSPLEVGVAQRLFDCRIEFHDQLLAAPRPMA
jgi:hypothetical protein